MRLDVGEGMKYPRAFHHKWRWQRVTRLMARDGTHCQICGGLLSRRVQDPTHDLYITFDHILPRSSGGLDELANLRLAHQACNRARGTDPVLPSEECRG